MDRRAAEASFDDPVIGRTTLGRTFEESAARNRNRIAQRYKGGIYERSLVSGDVVPAAPAGEYADLSYAEMRDVVRRLAAGFRALGLDPGDRVAIYAQTRMEWAHADFGVLAAGGVTTTVYPSASERRVRYLLSDPGASAVVAENVDLLERALAAAESTVDDGSNGDGTDSESAPVPLDFAVVVDEFDADTVETDVPLFSLAEVHERGHEAFDPDAYASRLDARGPDALASIIYTSGTTGRPKGVRLTHRNFRSNVNQCFRRLGPRPDRRSPAIAPESTTLSFLPLAHVFERLVGHFLMFAAGATVAYAETPDTLREDFRLVRPTVATSVPRVYENLYDSVRERSTDSRLGERIFERAVEVGKAHHETESPGPLLSAARGAADRLVFERVREALGGNIDFLISGGGSLPADLCTLYHAMGLPILEGYGLTETSPVVAVNPLEEPKVGTVGPPLHGVDVRVDEAVADSIDPEAGGEVGELLVRGPNVSPGYWNRPEETAAAFADGEPNADGVGGADEGPESDERHPSGEWFRTGDVVELRPDDYVVFRERAKQLLVLSTGENVVPGPIEDAFASSPLVEQCMVTGDGRKYVGALLVPDFEAVREWAVAERVDLPAERRAVCRDDRVRARIGHEVERVNEGFEERERIKRFRLVPEGFTRDNGLLTPTMKKRRRDILTRFDGEVESLYGESNGGRFDANDSPTRRAGR